MSQTPQQETGSKTYQDAWRAINVLIRSDGSWSGRERNVCYRNDGDGRFTDIAFVSGLDLDADGRSFAPFDLDGDGDLDLILKNRSGNRLRAFRNDAPRGRILTVKLRGTESNRDAVGAKLVLTTDRGRSAQELVSGSGYLSQRSRVAWFGIPQGARAEVLEVLWPSGKRSRFEDVPSSGEIVVTEGETQWVRWEPSRAGEPAPSEPAGLLTESPWLAEPVPAPAIELPSAGGTAWSLDDDGDGLTLVNFWASWCPPCRTELADFKAHADDFAAARVRVAAVSVDAPEERDAARRFAQEQDLPFPVLYADDRVVNAYTVLNERLFDRRRNLAVPTTFLIDGEGRIVKTYRGETSAEAILRDVQATERPALPFAGQWIDSGPDRDFVELATAYVERGLTADARPLFELALSRGAETPELLNNYAGLLLEEGDAEGAAGHLRRSLALEPRQPNAQVNLASALMRQGGDPAEASLLVENALAIQPDDPEALGLLASIRFHQGRTSDAERLFDRALALAPERPQPHENKAALLASTQRFAEAAAEYERAVELGGGGVMLFSNLGVLHMQLGDPARALVAFERALEEDPDDYGALLNMALYRLQAGDPAAAREWAEKARAVAPQRPEARGLLQQLP